MLELFQVFFGLRSCGHPATHCVDSAVLDCEQAQGLIQRGQSVRGSATEQGGKTPKSLSILAARNNLSEQWKRRSEFTLDTACQQKVLPDPLDPVSQGFQKLRPLHVHLLPGAWQDRRWLGSFRLLLIRFEFLIHC